MGSYFAKKPKPKETPFESLERKIEGMNPNSYPTFEKSLDWSKTKHVYSDSICIKEKYVSYTLISILFFFLFCFLFLSFRSNKSESVTNDFNGGIQIGDDVEVN
jgi:hypothetical protein